MRSTRRHFLELSAAGLLGSTLAQSQQPEATPSTTPGTPPAFGTAPPVGPAVTAETFRTAEKLFNIDLNNAALEEAAGNWSRQMAPLLERRVGPRKVALHDNDAPATLWNPTIPQATVPAQANLFVRSTANPGPLPASDEDIAFAPIHQLSRWIETRQLSSERLTTIYLDRLERFNKQLNCVITLTREHALQQARQADKEIAAGKYRGPAPRHPLGR